VSILPHEAKALLETILPSTNRIWLKAKELQEFFCLIRQNKIFFILADQDWIGLMIFKNFAEQDRIGFNFIGSGLGSD